MFPTSHTLALLQPLNSMRNSLSLVSISNDTMFHSGLNIGTELTFSSVAGTCFSPARAEKCPWNHKNH